LYLC